MLLTVPLTERLLECVAEPLTVFVMLGDTEFVLLNVGVTDLVDVAVKLGV